MYMNFNIILPGLEDAIITKAEEIKGTYRVHIKLPQRVQQCPECGNPTNLVHDYRIQRIQHLKMFERDTYLFYHKRRYRCLCGKRFPEKNKVVERYQRHTIEWNQALGIRVIQGKNFKDTAAQFRTSQATAIRRFDHISSGYLKEVKELPKVIAIDEYKGDTNEGKFQVIIANAQTGEPLDILPNRSVETVKNYLRQKGSHVEMVVMDMSYSFKSAVKQALGKPIIIADRFHFCRYIYWALDRVRRRVQKEFNEYDRKKCKIMRHVFYKPQDKLSKKQSWYLERYLKQSEELKCAYQLKESFRIWFETSKKNGALMAEVKEGLKTFYNQVIESGIKEFIQAIKTLKNWQIEILNSFAFGYTNGFVEGLNNQTKVIKRNAFGFKRYDRLRLRVLLHHQFKVKGIPVI
ncbi:ISL3 family transposase [Heyndrickxia ginsengihumi]